MAQIVYLLSNPVLWLVFAGLVLALVGLAWRLRLRWRPAWLLRVLLVGLTLVGIFWPDNPHSTAGQVTPRTVLVVDQSDSLENGSRLQAWQQAMQWQAGAEDRLVVAFGAQAEAVAPLAAAKGGVPLPPRELDGRASDIAGALRLAGSLLGVTPGKMILASDGRAALPGAVEQAAVELARQGHQLDTLPLPGRPAAQDLAVGSLSVPAKLWSGTSFDVLAPVYGAQAAPTEQAAPAEQAAPTEQAAQVSLWIDGREAGIEAEVMGALAGQAGQPRPTASTCPRCRPGLPHWKFGLPGTRGKTPTDRIIRPQTHSRTTMPRSAWCRCSPPHRCCLSRHRPERQRWNALLAHWPSATFRWQCRDRMHLPTGLAQLQTYGVIILHNLLSSQLSGEQLAALQIFVARRAGGLVVLGGRNSYLLGGYQGTRLEPMLPVKLEPPPRWSAHRWCFNWCWTARRA